MEGLFFLGSSVCHGLEERSLLIGEHFLPYCARCTGIYLGMALAAVFFYLAGRNEGDKPLCAMQIPIAALAFLPFMIDGVGSYLGLWQSNNLLRTLTGLPAGISLPYFFILLKNFDVHETAQRPIYKNVWEQVLLLLAGFLLVLFVYFGGFGLYFPIAIGMALGMLYFLMNIFGLLLSLVPEKRLSKYGRRVCQCFCVMAWVLGIGWLRLYLRI